MARGSKGQAAPTPTLRVLKAYNGHNVGDMLHEESGDQRTEGLIEQGYLERTEQPAQQAAAETPPDSSARS